MKKYHIGLAIDKVALLTVVFVVGMPQQLQKFYANCWISDDCGVTFDDCFQHWYGTTSQQCYAMCRNIDNCGVTFDGCFRH